ncbi:MAG: hypothetical protein ACC651_18040 [Candidatus Scalindua sp.]
MLKDMIIEEVRKNRKEIEKKLKDWKGLEKYFYKLQKRHQKKLFRGKPQIIPKEKAAKT